MTFLGQKVAEDICDGQAAYKELLKNMGYRLWVSRLTISKGENKHDITLNLENSGVAPLYGDWTVVLYLCDTSGKVVQSQDLDCRLSELLPNQTAELKASFAYSKKSEVSSEVRNYFSNDTSAFCSFCHEWFRRRSYA